MWTKSRIWSLPERSVNLSIKTSILTFALSSIMTSQSIQVYIQPIQIDQPASIFITLTVPRAAKLSASILTPWSNDVDSPEFPCKFPVFHIHGVRANQCQLGRWWYFWWSSTLHLIISNESRLTFSAMQKSPPWNGIRKDRPYLQGGENKEEVSYWHSNQRGRCWLVHPLTMPFLPDTKRQSLCKGNAIL